MTENCFGINEWQFCNLFKGAVPAGTYGPCTGPGGLQDPGTKQPGPFTARLPSAPTSKQILQAGVRLQPWQTPPPGRQPGAQLTPWRSTVPSRDRPALGAKDVPQNFKRSELFFWVESWKHHTFSSTPRPQIIYEHTLNISRQLQKRS